MNKPHTHKILYLIRAYSLGGVISNSLLQAQAEKSLERQVKLWVWLQTQRQEFDVLATRYDLPIRQVTGLELIIRLLSTHFERTPRSLVNIQSGLARISQNVRLIRKLMPSQTPLVLSLQGPSAFEPHTELAWRERQVANSHLVSAIIVPSEMERQVQIDAGIMPEKVFVVPCIIEPKVVQPGSLRSRLLLQPDTPVVLFCGRLDAQKNPLQTIEAFRYVVARYPTAVLVIAGEGILLAQCEEAVRELGSVVHFLGHVDDVDSLYADADVFVAPSIAESFGRTAMEAALTKTPMVLGCIRPWSDYFLPGTDCEFVEPQNSRSIADGIVRLLDDPSRARLLAENAFQVVTARFSQGKALDALSQAYEYAWANF